MSANKNNLQKVIQDQNEKINRLEKAFRGEIISTVFKGDLFVTVVFKFLDVTGAYKTLLTEKETLQASIKLLTTEKAVKSNDTSDEAAKASDSDYGKIAALTLNIQNLVDSKAKLEANFQLERKNLKVNLVAVVFSKEMNYLVNLINVCFFY